MKRIFLLFTIVATLLVGGLSLFAAYRAERGGPAPLHVVVVGPMSGKSAAKGEAMVNGAKLFAERYNAQLAEGGRPIFIAPVDDQNDPRLAEQVARVIATDTTPALFPASISCVMSPTKAVSSSCQPFACRIDGISSALS